MSLIRQLSLFGVEASAPEPGDLAGLLAGAGRIDRLGHLSGSHARQPGQLGGSHARQPGQLGGSHARQPGGTARVSIVVDHPWRAAALVAECARRGLVATVLKTVDEHIEVRTAYSAALMPLADAWSGPQPLANGAKHPPRGLLLDGRALRLWVEAAGRYEGATTYALELGVADEPVWSAVGAALAALGLRGQLVVPRSGIPAYRIVGKRRVAALAEMIGDPPKQAPAGLWPS